MGTLHLQQIMDP